jgi:hypothetical protein
VAEIACRNHAWRRGTKNPGKIFCKIARKLSPTRSKMTMIDNFGHLYLLQIARTCSCSPPVSIAPMLCGRRMLCPMWLLLHSRAKWKTRTTAENHLARVIVDTKAILNHVSLCPFTSLIHATSIIFPPPSGSAFDDHP